MSKIVEGAKEALAVAKGEIPAARITIAGHAYVPATALEAKDKELAALRAEIKVAQGCAQATEYGRAKYKSRAEVAENRVKVLEARQADDLAEFGLMEARAETAERERD